MYRSTALREAQLKLKSFNEKSDACHATLHAAIEKKVSVLEDMEEDLKHIYSQLRFLVELDDSNPVLSYIERRLSESGAL